MKQFRVEITPVTPAAAKLDHPTYVYVDAYTPTEAIQEAKHYLKRVHCLDPIWFRLTPKRVKPVKP